jgi:hypothetical protein
VKKLLVAISLTVFASLCFMSIAGLVFAQKAGYEIDDYEAITVPTIDGTWSSTDEWTDASEVQLEQLGDEESGAFFRIKHSTDPGTGDISYYYLLIEVLNDTTNDSEDLQQLCMVGANEVGGTPEATTMPNENCIRFDYEGHDVSGFRAYRGTGTDWTTETNYTWETDVLIVDSFDVSPLSDTPHLISEVKISATAFNINPEYWIRVATFDESVTSSAGMKMWPIGSREDPNDWGRVEVMNESIPELPAWTILPIFVTATLAVTLYKKRLASSETKP